MSLTALLKTAALFGFDTADLKKMALEQGVQFTRDWLKGQLRERMEAAVPGILQNLEKKAPLDGKRRTDKDGVEFSDREFLAHESLYLVVKSILKKGGPVIDGWRDAHLAKVLAFVNTAAPTTPEAVVRAVIDAELAVTF